MSHNSRLLSRVQIIELNLDVPLKLSFKTSFLSYVQFISEPSLKPLCDSVFNPFYSIKIVWMFSIPKNLLILDATINSRHFSCAHSILRHVYNLAMTTLQKFTVPVAIRITTSTAPASRDQNKK